MTKTYLFHGVFCENLLTSFLTESFGGVSRVYQGASVSFRSFLGLQKFFKVFESPQNDRVGNVKNFMTVLMPIMFHTVEAGARTSRYQFLPPIQTFRSNPILSLQWSELFSRDLIILLENPPFAIFGRLNGAGKLLYFTPILPEIATFHPHIASQGKDFVAPGLSGLENQSCLGRRRGGGGEHSSD